MDSRKVEEVGRVLELVGDTEVRQRSLVLQAAWLLGCGGVLDASYTLNETLDHSTFNCCIARTSVFTELKDDPRDLSTSWGPSNNDFRHKIALAAVLPPVWGGQLSGRYVGQSGRPVSAIINGDVNGDDIANNDLAFVFDPDDPSTPPDIAAAMRRVLENPENRFREYLLDNLGRIADRNGGRNPFAGQIDVRASKTLDLPRGQRFEIIADIYNVAHLLNREWGGVYDAGNQTLLAVRESVERPSIEEARDRLLRLVANSPSAQMVFRPNRDYPMLAVENGKEAERVISEAGGLLKRNGDRLSLTLRGEKSLRRPRRSWKTVIGTLTAIGVLVGSWRWLPGAVRALWAYFAPAEGQ